MGNLKHFLVVLVQGCLFLVIAVSIPLESTQDESSLRLTLPANPVTNITAPDLPPDFRTTVNYLKGRKTWINPSTLHVNAIHAMYLLIQLTGWDSTVTEEKVITFPDVDMVMVFQAVSDCKLSYWLFGLYQADIEMTNSGNYKAAIVQLLLGQTKIGTIRVLLNHPTSIDDVAYTNSNDIGGVVLMNSTLTDVASAPADNSTSNSTLTAMSGQITDPTHRLFKINWTIAGKHISAADIFTAILDNMINCGPNNPHEEVQNTHGISASGKVAISFVQTRPYPGVRNLTCDVLLRALDLTADVLWKNRKFGETSFQLTWNGFIFAEGHVVELDEAVMGNGTMGASVQR